jgi:lipopolysaccharide/colanic/teichoic acid biosynthesis glycosyltransferase
MGFCKPVVPMSPGSLHVDLGRLPGWLSSLLNSNRFVLGMGLIFAIVLPEAIHQQVSSWGPWFSLRSPGHDSSLVAAIAAIVISHVASQRMGDLPLISARTLILPTFLMAFGAALLFLLLFNFAYDIYHLWSALALSLVWYYTIALCHSRLLSPVVGLYGLVADDLDELPRNIKWRIIYPHEQHRGLAAVVIDPHATLDVEGAQFITQLVLDGVPVYHRAHIEEGLSGRVRFSSHAENNFGALLPSLLYLRAKRSFDLLGVIPLLFLMIPVLVIAALAIKLEDGGPILFSQARRGYRGVPFQCFKLRTMRVDMSGPAFTRDGDQRITRCGRLLRKWRIDEIPQLWNIVTGEMSWIGPRPEAIELAELYAANIPFYDYRHALRPGISGWAAVHQGNVAMIDAARLKLEYDFFYIKYFSFWLDSLIVLKTLATVVSGSGSR